MSGVTSLTTTGRYYEQQKRDQAFFEKYIVENENMPIYVKIPLGISSIVCMILIAIAVSQSK